MRPLRQMLECERTRMSVGRVGGKYHFTSHAEGTWPGQVLGARSELRIMMIIGDTPSDLRFCYLIARCVSLGW